MNSHQVAGSKSCKSIVSAISAYIALREILKNNMWGMTNVVILRVHPVYYILLYLPCCRNAGGPRYIGGMPVRE